MPTPQFIASRGLTKPCQFISRRWRRSAGRQDADPILGVSEPVKNFRWASVVATASAVLFPHQCAGAERTAAGEMSMAQQSAPMAPARDGNIAIQEEFDVARRANTLDAYDLFIARHSDHQLATTAKRERELLRKQLQRNP
jgi:hypothetical protein